MNIRYFAKTLYPVGATVMMAVLSTADGGITAGEWLTIAIGGCTAVVTFVAPNVPNAPYVKIAMVAILSVLNFLTGAIDGGLTQTELINCAMLLLSGLGVFQHGNVGDTLDVLTKGRHVATA